MSSDLEARKTTRHNHKNIVNDELLVYKRTPIGSNSNGKFCRENLNSMEAL